MIKFVNKSVLLLLLSFMFLFSSSQLKAETNKNVILVLDTSLSMVGYGGKNILGDVKESINTYVDSLEDGDRVTFVTFDEKVRLFPQVLIDDKNDRDILKKYISVTEAKGQWTHTLKMLKTVFSIADELSKKKDDEERNLVIVIMTDGLDDPPPGKRKEKFNLKKIAEQYSGNNWWIYLVNLADLEKSDKISKAQQELKKELTKVSENTKIIGGSDPDKAINQDVKGDVDQKVASQNKMTAFFIALGVLALFLIFFFLIRRKRGDVVPGELEYWNHELLKPEVKTADLSLLGLHEVSVGRNPECSVKIREYESRIPFIIRFVRSEGQARVELSPGDGLDVNFKNKENEAMLNDGDIFQASNYSFKYNVSEK